MYPTSVRLAMSSSHMQQRGSSGAALGARLRVAACLEAKVETSGDDRFQFSGHLHPRLWWIFLQLTLHRGGSRGCRCTVGDNRCATKLSNPSEPRVPIRTHITAAKSTRSLSARAVICAQDNLRRFGSHSECMRLLHAAAEREAAGGAHARILDTIWTLSRAR